MRFGWLGVIIVAMLATWSCWDTTYHCTRDEQCTLHGASGSCEANGYCSFASATCPSTRAYGDHSPLAGTCVPPTGGGDDLGVPPPPCGNGMLDTDEMCDPAIAPPNAGACPVAADCDDHNPCTSDSVEGSAAQCSARCAHSFITTCGPVEQCCPVGCNSATDADCSGTCGNGVVDGTEKCDKAIAASQTGACPTTCPPQNGCTSYTLIGAASVCTAQCAATVMASCSGALSSDGCCPPGCSLLNDADCT